MDIKELKNNTEKYFEELHKKLSSEILDMECNIANSDLDESFKNIADIRLDIAQRNLKKGAFIDAMEILIQIEKSIK